MEFRKVNSEEIDLAITDLMQSYDEEFSNLCCRLYNISLSCSKIMLNELYKMMAPHCASYVNYMNMCF